MVAIYENEVFHVRPRVTDFESNTRYISHTNLGIGQALSSSKNTRFTL